MIEAVALDFLPPPGAGRERVLARFVMTHDLMHHTVNWSRLDRMRVNDSHLPEPKRKREPVTDNVDPDALLTAARAAARLSITVAQLTAHVEDGALKYINVGRGKKKPRRRFSPSDLEEFKAARSTLEKSCPSSSQRSPRPITGTASKSNVVGFSALRAARMKKTPSGSKR